MSRIIATRSPWWTSRTEWFLSVDWSYPQNFRWYRVPSGRWSHMWLVKIDV